MLHPKYKIHFSVLHGKASQSSSITVIYSQLRHVTFPSIYSICHPSYILSLCQAMQHLHQYYSQTSHVQHNYRLPGSVILQVVDVVWYDIVLFKVILLFGRNPAFPLFSKNVQLFYAYFTLIVQYVYLHYLCVFCLFLIYSPNLTRVK